MPPGYDLHIGGFGQTTSTVELDEACDFEAVLTAFGGCSPRGHSLWNGRRFLGYFDAGAGRIPHEFVLQEARPKGRLQ